MKRRRASTSPGMRKKAGSVVTAYGATPPACLSVGSSPAPRRHRKVFMTDVRLERMNLGVDRQALDHRYGRLDTFCRRAALAILQKDATASSRTERTVQPHRLPMFVAGIGSASAASRKSFSPSRRPDQRNVFDRPAVTGSARCCRRRPHVKRKCASVWAHQRVPSRR